jgi:error-prone DNA polymerase
VDASDYVELRCRSAFSFLEGASNPEDLAARAAELGHRALALADRGGVYGLPRFHQAARAADLRAIHGATCRVGDGRAAAAPRPGAAPAGAAEPALAGAEAPSLLLLAESREGYRHLCRLLTRGQARAPKGECLATWDELEEHAAGLVALARGDGRLTRAFLDRVQATFPGRTFVDVSRTRERSVLAEGRYAAALAEAARVPVVATGDVRCARPEDRRTLDALACLRAKTSLDRAGRLLAANDERCLRPPAETARRFADRPAWVRATRAVAERCAFGFEDLGYRFPTFPVPPGETQAGWLRRLTFEGARGRYGDPLPPRARAQLERELAVIEKLDLAGYFLIVWDLARFARERGMLCQGRGSAANSAVCYALGITAVDPVGMELLFERFLSEERGEWPDIDLDLPSGDQREEAIQYVYRTYGPHGAGMTAVVITWRTRSAVREMGKVLGFPPTSVDRLAKLLSSFDYREDQDELRRTLQRSGVDPAAPRVARLLELVERVKGLPRHLGQHTGGLVIAAGRLDEVVPLEPASMPGRTVIQWDKDDCADLGIIKIDLLGLGMLQALEEALPLVARHEGVSIDLAKLPPDDPDTYAMIQRADTVGVFQIESRAQMATLPRLRPRCFYDLVVEIAIIRPGPIVGQMVHPYLNRRAGREAVSYPHPCLEPILERTLGVPIFQEQLLRIAMEAAGFSGGEAEELRRAMGFKRSMERMKAIEARLRRGMAARGITGEAQERIVQGILSFALYGFPESHSASFALIAYASAYLKAHHPAAFLAGLLNAWPMGFYHPATLVTDAARHGVEVRPIDAARSAWKATLEPRSPDAARAPGPARATDEPGRAPALPTGAGARGPAVRLGLRCVAGLRAEAAERLVAERERAPFASAADLAGRVGLRRAELDALAELGALASLDPAAATRRAALWQVAALERDPRSLFAGVPPASGPSPLAEMTPFEETLADYRASGITTGPHAMAHLRPGLAARGVLETAALRAVPDGRLVRVAGHVIVRQRPGSAKGFCFLTLEDETGTANAVLTPRVFERFRVPLHTSSVVEVAGPVQNVEGVIHVRVRSLEPVRLPEALPASHDYR